MIFRFGIALLLLLGSAVLIASAGGIAIMSPAEWAAITQKWDLPSKADTEQCLKLLTGILVGLMAVFRVMSPTTSKPYIPTA